MPGGEIEKNLKDSDIGKNEVMKGKLNNKNFTFLMMKKLAFFIKMTRTYDDLDTKCDQEKTTWF